MLIGTINNIFMPQLGGVVCTLGLIDVAAAFRPPYGCGALKGAATIADDLGFSGPSMLQGLNRFICHRSDGGAPSQPVHRVELGIEKLVAGAIESDLAALSDKERLEYIKCIANEFERHFERSPSDDISTLRERLALVSPLAEEACQAHDRLLSQGVQNSLWGHGELCNLFDPLARVAVDIEARIIKQNALNGAVSGQIADILFYRILKGYPAFDLFDGDPLAVFSQLPDVIARYRALGFQEKMQRAETHLREVQSKFKVKKDPSVWALGGIEAEIGKHLALMSREIRNQHKRVWLGALNNIVKLAGRYGNYRFAAEVFGYYADRLSEVGRKARESGAAEELISALDKALVYFKEELKRAQEMGLAIGIM